MEDAEITRQINLFIEKLEDMLDITLNQDQKLQVHRLVLENNKAILEHVAGKLED